MSLPTFGESMIGISRGVRRFVETLAPAKRLSNERQRVGLDRAKTEPRQSQDRAKTEP